MLILIVLSLANLDSVIGIRNEELLKEFGHRLRGARNDRGISQEKLANLCGITISQVSRIERGEVNTTLSTLYILAKSLDIELSKLLDFQSEF